MQILQRVDQAAITDRQENGVSVIWKVWTVGADHSPLQGFELGNSSCQRYRAPARPCPGIFLDED